MNRKLYDKYQKLNDVEKKRAISIIVPPSLVDVRGIHQQIANFSVYDIAWSHRCDERCKETTQG